MQPSRRSLIRGAAAFTLAGLASTMSASSDGIAMPAWLRADIRRRAKWLPRPIIETGLDQAYRQRWSSLPGEIRGILTDLKIPAWLIALIPTTPAIQDEVLKQFQFMVDLPGEPPANSIAARLERLLLFGGAAQLPTPGDDASGLGLGAEGCTAAIARYVLAQLEIEFPLELAAMSRRLATTQSSTEMQKFFMAAQRTGIVAVESKLFDELRYDDFRPGSLTIAHKPGGTHVFGWTRVPNGWNWEPCALMAIGNTGLPQFGDHMILAQEYVTCDPAGSSHNAHGPINSRRILYRNGLPDLSDARTNVYAAQGGNFTFIHFMAVPAV
jgi:hypothetical protein